MVICIEQRLSNIWSSIYEKVKQHWGWVEKSVVYKKGVSLVLKFGMYRSSDKKILNAVSKCEKGDSSTRWFWICQQWTAESSSSIQNPILVCEVLKFQKALMNWFRILK